MMTHRANGVHDDDACAFIVCVCSLSRERRPLIALKYSDIAAFRFPREKKVLTEKTLEREEEKKERFFLGFRVYIMY